MTSISKNFVSFYTVTDNDNAQRLDNFLLRYLKGVPKSHIHRIIRNGEIRIDKRRASADTRLITGQIIRIPPVRVAEKNLSGCLKNIPATEFPIVYEDDFLLVIDKPSGVAAHGGSGVSSGVIEQIRAARPKAKYLELVHRLDKDTSGLLMIAKKRRTVVKLHEQLRQNHPKKIYLALCSPVWKMGEYAVKLPLKKYTGQNGEKMVRVDKNGQYAHTIFRVKQQFQAACLVEAELKTGRTHQIRVHLQAHNHPILGDERYGNYEKNKQWSKEFGLKRMFLHAWQLTIRHPETDKELILQAELPKELQNIIHQLEKEYNA